MLPAEYVAGAVAEPGTTGAAAEVSSSGTKGSPSKQVKKKTAKITTPSKKAAKKTSPAKKTAKENDPGNKPPLKSGLTTTAPPDAPAAPANGSVLEHGFVGFTWPRAIGFPPYQIQVSSDRNFKSMVVNIATDAASLVTSTELVPGTYYWRVRGKTATGQNRKPSPVWSFKVSAAAPLNTMTDTFINHGMVSTNSPTVSLALSAKGSSDIVAYAVWPNKYAPEPGELTWVPVNPSTRFADVVPYAVSRDDGVKTVSVRFKDKAGMVSAAKSSVITLDTTPPETTITDQPEDPSETTAANFSFTSTKSGSTFHCSLDDGVFAACSSPWSFSGLLGGKHTVAVRATDAAGNSDPTPARFSWVATPPLQNTTPPGFINKGSPITHRDTVRLFLSASTTKKEGVAGYYISESPDIPAITDPDWIVFKPVEIFKREVEYTLSPGTGKKVVYVWFKDEAGNISDVQIDIISRLNSTYVVLIFFLIQALVIL